ncbi:MAG: hypothetical protein IJP23_00150 [Oscillospiraceae bacterium]|nr:hypothetical protein [Oscillospiraceae bacterium]
MKSNDTVRLLRECESGVKMGIESINEGILKARGNDLKLVLESSLSHHKNFISEINGQLCQHEEPGKEPPVLPRAASWLKTEAMTAMKPTDSTVAELMSDGCTMGVKSLTKYLNQYKAADTASRELTRKIIAEEESLGKNLRPFL